MHLDTEQMKRVVDKLNSIGPTPVCPACQHTDWLVAERIYQMREFGPATGGAMIPMVVTVCKICGFMHFFNAINIGVVPGRPEGI